MAMSKVAITKVIESIANQLPVVMEHTSELHYVDGEELIAQGHTELSNGEKVIADKKYSQHLPVLIAVNHKRRLMNAFKQRGGEGISEYIRSINEMIDKRQMGRGQFKVDSEGPSPLKKVNHLLCKIKIKIQSLLNQLKPIKVKLTVKL
jgi:hypothetical protein